MRGRNATKMVPAISVRGALQSLVQRDVTERSDGWRSVLLAVLLEAQGSTT